MTSKAPERGNMRLYGRERRKYWRMKLEEEQRLADMDRDAVEDWVFRFWMAKINRKDVK